MALTGQEKNKYIQDVVLKYFNTLKTQPISSTLFSTDGMVLAITDQTLKQFGLKYFSDISPDAMLIASSEFILKCTGLPQEYAIDVKEICHLILKLEQIAMQEKTIVSVNNFIPRHGKIRSSLIHCVPIFHPNGEVVAVQTISTEFRVFHVSEYLKYMPLYQQKPLTISADLYNLPLST